MNDLPSSEFRRVFPRLTERTAVTVHGHVIGYYEPVFTATDSRALDTSRPGEPVDRFNTRPFTPVPKPKR
jgi:hypothetical protein